MEKADNITVYDTGNSDGRKVSSAKSAFADEKGIPYRDTRGAHIAKGYVAVWDDRPERSAKIYGWNDDLVYVDWGHKTEEYVADSETDSVQLSIEPIGITLDVFYTNMGHWSMRVNDSGAKLSCIDVLTGGENDPSGDHSECIEITAPGLEITRMS